MSLLRPGVIKQHKTKPSHNSVFTCLVEVYQSLARVLLPVAGWVLSVAPWVHVWMMQVIQHVDPVVLPNH